MKYLLTIITTTVALIGTFSWVYFQNLGDNKHGGEFDFHKHLQITNNSDVYESNDGIEFDYDSNSNDE